MDAINEAIETIKGYCGKFKNCESGCRFYNKEDGCEFQNTVPPIEWEFVNSESEVSA